MSLVARLAGQRRGVDADRHAQRGLVDRDHRQRPRVVEVGDRLADRDLRDAGDRDDLAGAGPSAATRASPRSRRAPRRARSSTVPSRRHQATFSPLRDRARGARGRARAGRRRRRRRGWSRAPAGRGPRRTPARGSRSTSRLEQRAQVGALVALGQRRPAGLGVGVDDRELDLLLVGVEVEEQLVDLVDDLGDAGVGPVDLVDARGSPAAGLERLAQHEARLRQRALGGVDEQHHAVDHRQPALDLAAEVGVAGRVDDVDLHRRP